MLGTVWLRRFSLVVSVAAIGYFIIVLAKTKNSLPVLSLDLEAVLILGLLVGLYGCLILVSGAAWHILLRAVGEPARLRDSITILAIAQFAKYLPGNFAHQVGRVVLAKSCGMDTARVIFTMTLEASWAILAACSVVLMLALISSTDGQSALPGRLSEIQIVVIGAVAIAVPVVMGYVLRVSRFSLMKRIARKVTFPGAGPLTICFFLNLVIFSLLGFSLTVIATDVFDVHSGGVFFAIAVYTGAWVAGFLTPGAPAGLGVREAIMVAALSPVFGSGHAVAITITLRLISIIGDVVAFSIAFFYRHWSENIGTS